MKKKLVFLLLAVCFILSFESITLTANASSRGITAHGQEWFLYDNGLLFVTGAGALPNYPREAEWEPHSDEITSVVFDEGITHIGDNAFRSAVLDRGFQYLTTVEIPSSVKSIGTKAFAGCASLETITFSGDAPTLGADVFANLPSTTIFRYQRNTQGWDSSVWSGFNLQPDDAGFDNFQKVSTYIDSQFTDVPSESWYTDTVIRAYELGLVKGTSANSFSPNGNISIAETIALACRLNNGYHANGNPFQQENPWYQVYVDYAIKHGIITKDQFSNYTKTATRLEFAAILAKALPRNALEPINNITSLPDVALSSTYSDSIFLLYNAGILTGSDSYGTFSPSAAITRCEVATIVTRMADVSSRKTFSLSIKPTMSASATAVTTSSFEEPAIIYITCDIEDATLSFRTSNGIVAPVWGDWVGDSLPLIIFPAQIGKSTIFITNDKAHDSLAISVTVSDYFFTDDLFLGLAEKSHEHLLSVLKNPASLQIHSVYSAYLSGRPAIIMDYSGMNGYGGYNRTVSAFMLDASLSVVEATMTANDMSHLAQVKEIPVSAITN